MPTGAQPGWGGGCTPAVPTGDSVGLWGVCRQIIHCSGSLFSQWDSVVLQGRGEPGPRRGAGLRAPPQPWVEAWRHLGTEAPALLPVASCVRGQYLGAEGTVQFNFFSPALGLQVLLSSLLY